MALVVALMLATAGYHGGLPAPHPHTWITFTGGGTLIMPSSAGRSPDHLLLDGFESQRRR